MRAPPRFYPITAHAIVRYIERVMGHDLNPVRLWLVGQDDDASDSAVIRALRDNGFDLDYVNRRIFTRATEIAVEHRNASVKTDDCVLVIRDFTVVTVLSKGWNARFPRMVPDEEAA